MHALIKTLGIDNFSVHTFPNGISQINLLLYYCWSFTTVALAFE